MMMALTPVSKAAIGTRLRRYKINWQHVVHGHEDSGLSAAAAARDQAAEQGGCGGCGR